MRKSLFIKKEYFLVKSFIFNLFPSNISRLKNLLETSPLNYFNLHKLLTSLLNHPKLPVLLE